MLAAAAMVAFWIVALATDWDAQLALVLLWLARAPSIFAPLYERWRGRRASRRGTASARG